MSTLFYPLAMLAETLASEGSRLKKRAAIAQAIGDIAKGSTPVSLPGSNENGAQSAAPAGSPHPNADTGAEPADPLNDAGLFAMYLAGLPFSESDPRKLSAGGALLSKAVLAVTGATGPELTVAYRRHGDLGAAAHDLLLARDAAKSPVITLAEVARSFNAMATARTTALRAATVETLLGRATPIEAKYLLKLMLGDMRIGVKQSLVEEGVAVAAAADVIAVRRAVMLEADLAFAVRRAFLGTLADARMRLFHPLGFMLASPVDSPEEAIDRFTPKPRKVLAPKPPKPAKRTRTKTAAAPDPDSETQVAADAAEAFSDAPELDTIAGNQAADADDRETGDLAALDAEAPQTDLQTDLQTAAPAPAEPAIQALLEDKYDGMRAQLHFADPAAPGRVAIYSRNREDITESFPELVEAFSSAGEESGLILDGEILGWDIAQNRALPFAVLSPRIGRKRITADVRRAIPVVFMAFDLMYAAGELQLDRPLRDRRHLLEQIAEQLSPSTRSTLDGPPPAPKPAKRTKAQTTQVTLAFAGAAEAPAPSDPTAATLSPAPDELARDEAVQRLLLSPARLVATAAEIDKAYADARARANEGVMLKDAASLYQPGRRGLAWVKLKRELATLDVVITGAEFGTGRRSQLLSDYTFAVRGPRQDGLGTELLNVGKAYSGVTDQEILDLTAWLKAHTLEDFGHFRTVEPEIILEVAFNNIMRSDRHRSGYALRFPRILRIRTDKPVAEIDTVQRVEEVYQSQVDKPADTDTATGTEDL